MRKKIVSVAICFVMMVSLLPQTQLFATAATSGICGNDLFWELDEVGVLMISGMGDMTDFYSAARVPWYSVRGEIREVVIEEGVTSIGSYAFKNCEGLEKITISDSVMCIGEDAFYNTAYYNNTDNWESEILYISNHLIEAKWTVTGEVEIRQGIRCIGEYAFRSCRDLESIIIPDSVIGIGAYAFYDCLSLESVYITDVAKWCAILFGETANPLMNDGAYLYVNNQIETNIVIPDSVTAIGAYAFFGYENLESVIIPDSVTSIGELAFYGCEKLKRIVIPSGVTTIGEYMFCGCRSLENITIPLGVVTIGNAAFQECISLISIALPSSVKSIGDSAFRECENLEYINVPSSVTSIGDGVFYDCDKLTMYGKQGSYAEEYAAAHYVKFVAVSEPETIEYSFGQSVQIGLIEPWFLKANTRVYTDENPINIDYDSLVDYGAYFIRKSELVDTNATQESLAVEDIINDTDSVKYSKSAGTATVDGSYITATYDKGLYTYELDDSVFVLFYIEDESGITYVPIRERNLKKLCEERKDDAAKFPNVLERNVYRSMLDMYNTIRAYRDDYFSKTK